MGAITAGILLRICAKQDVWVPSHDALAMMVCRINHFLDLGLLAASDVGV